MFARRIGALAVIAAGVAYEAAPREIPIRALSEPSAVSRELVGVVAGIKQLTDGGLLVNDAQRRRLLRFDPTLASYEVLLDSATDKSPHYPAIGRPLIPSVADSTLFADVGAGVFIVIDSQGRLGRAVAPPKARDP